MTARMGRGRLTRQVVALALVGVFAAGCSSPRSSPATGPADSGTTSPSPSGAPTPHTWSIVALGDSVPHGSACVCTPYPELTGVDLAAPPERRVTVANDAVGGYTTKDVLTQLQSDAAVVDRVRTSDIVELEVGANDVAYSASCGTSVACYEPTIPLVQKDLMDIVARIHALTAGRKVLVVLLDYWSVWIGGPS